MTALDLRQALMPPALRGRVVIVRSGHMGAVLWPQLWGARWTALDGSGRPLGSAPGYWRLRRKLRRERPGMAVPMSVMDIDVQAGLLWPRRRVCRTEIDQTQGGLS